MDDLIYYKNGEETFRISPPTVRTKTPKTKLEVKKMDELITLNLTLKELQQIDKFVEINDDTLSVLEKIKDAYPPQKMNLEKSGEFSIVSYNGETYYRNLYDGICGGWYKTDTDGEVFYLVEDETERKLEKLYQEQVVVKEPEENEWKTVALGFGENLSAIGPCGYYDFSPGEWVEWALNAYEKTADDYLRLLKKEPKKEQKWDVVRESVKWCEEHPNENPLDWVKPQTPEEVAEGLRNAMRQAKKEGVFDEPTKPMDDVVDRLVKKYQVQKLWNILKDKCGFSKDACNEIVDAVEEWLPEPQSAAGSQNLDVEFLVDGFNDAIRKMKEMLR